MNDAIAKSYAMQLDDLVAFVQGSWPWPSPEAAFSRYVYHTGEEKDPIAPGMEGEWPDGNPLQQAPILAVGGFLFSLNRMASSTAADLWRNGFARLTKRNAFPSDRQSFAYRPVELLGLALGTALCPCVCDDDKNWFVDVMRKLEHDGEPGVWTSILNGIAANIVGMSWNRAVGIQLDLLESHELSLVKWCLEAHPSAEISKRLTSPNSEIDRQLLRRLGTTAFRPADVAQASLVHFALRRVITQYVDSSLATSWQIGKEERDAACIVVSLCRRFPLFARYIRERRKDKGISRPTIEIRDEYDVQDAMYALMNLHFDDVRREEWTPSYAGSHSRMDFLLKKHKLVVEVKMTRKGLDQREVVRQLAVDKEHYRAHSDCQTLVCFVFDPDGICTNPTALECDASETTDHLSTTVVVGPKGL